MAYTKYIIFKLDDRKYCMELLHINGIEHDYNIVPMPCSAENIKGIIKLRQDVIPVFDIKNYFGMWDGDNHSDRQMLISETHGIKLGIEVDEVVGIVEEPDERVQDVPVIALGSDTRCFKKIISIDSSEKNGDEIVLCVSIDGIMSDEDFRRVTEALESRVEEED